MSGNIIKVLVVDDSAYIRKVISQMLSMSPFIQVVGTAKNGLEALEEVQRLKPDVVISDLIMPQMDGVQFIKEQMRRSPLPIVVCSIASENGELALKALEAGAVDFIQKPTALATEKVFEISSELVEKIKTAAYIPINKIITASTQPLPTPSVNASTNKNKTLSKDIVLIGISTGGPQALRFIIPQIPEDFPVPICVAMHMPVGYTDLFAQRMQEIAKIKFVEAKENDKLQPGTGYLAPAGKHLKFVKSGDEVLVHLDYRPFDTPHKPSVDVMFNSAAENFKNRTLAVVMTGMGNDGCAGAAKIKSAGGKVITEHPDSCIVYGMPRAVCEAGLSDKSVKLENLLNVIMEEIYG